MFPYRFPMAKCLRLPLMQVVLFVASVLSASAQNPSSIPGPMKVDISSANPSSEATEGEMRGLWVVRDSLSSREKIRHVVATAVKYRFNALFVQVRGRGDAWYNSPYEPRAETIAHLPASFDPLKEIVQEAHASGLQVHAWLNTYLTWSGSHRPNSPQHLWNAHPNWFACDCTGKKSPVPTDISEGVFLSPGHPEVQQHLFNVFTYVAENYDIDGIHFDYCRYANSTYDFSKVALERFREEMATQLTLEECEKFDARLSTDRLAYVHAFGSAWQAWRREQVTGLVGRISAAVKAKKPWMQVTAAVFANAEDAYKYRGQDWRQWLKAGYLDAVALMAYDKNTERILEQTRQAVAAAGEKHVYTGIGAWRLQAHDVAEKIAGVRATGAAGVNLFSYDGIHTRDNYLDTLARGVFASRAAPRRMRWLPPRKSVSPPKVR